ncbi:MAG: CDP-alcohol phosphatidyltransferase family protein [Anaeromyxobacteraceae bacterium]
MTAGQLAITSLVGTAAATSLLYLAARPAPPARVAGPGLIPLLGRWAYFVSRPVLRAAGALGISANGMTAIGLALTTAASLLVGLREWGLAAVLLVFGSWCDLLDGELARSTSTQSPAGAFLDSNLDRISEITLFAGVGWAFTHRSGTFWAAAAVVASLMVSYARARGEGLGVDCPGFGLERPHRLVAMMFTLIGAEFLPGDGALLLVEVVCVLVTVGAGATAVGRMVVIYRALRARDDGKSSAARPLQSPPAQKTGT